MSEGASFETDRHRDDQPMRDDLLDPRDIDPDEVVDHDEAALRAQADDEAGVLPEPDALPESQGSDVLTAAQLAEDATTRPPVPDDPVPDEPV
jgi:hypothetical protein